MRPQLTVHIDTSGHPFVEVPPQWIWDLVEHLNYSRPQVTYRFESECFKAIFHHQLPQQAQQLVDTWTQTREAPSEYAGV